MIRQQSGKCKLVNSTAAVYQAENCFNSQQLSVTCACSQGAGGYRHIPPGSNICQIPEVQPTGERGLQA